MGDAETIEGDDLATFVSALPPSLSNLRFSLFLNTVQLLSLVDRLPFSLLETTLDRRFYIWPILSRTPSRVAEFEAVRQAAAQRGAVLRMIGRKPFVLLPFPPS